MKFFTFFFLFIQLVFVNAQELQTKYLKEIHLKADTFIGVDNFENYYYIKSNTLYKKTNQQIFTYTNTQLGEITSVDISNPLKVLLFYKDFNTVLFLDNKLNELTTSINFTSESFSQQITFVNISSNNNLWLYSLDDNVLQLWNHQTKKIQFTSQPLSSYIDNFSAILLLSSYKNCWLIGEGSILKFNEYGIFLASSTIDSHTLVNPFQDGFLYSKGKELFHYKPSKDIQKVDLKNEVIIKSFYINSDHIYIFDGTKIFVFRIIKNK